MTDKAGSLTGLLWDLKQSVSQSWQQTKWTVKTNYVSSVVKGNNIDWTDYIIKMNNEHVIVRNLKNNRAELILWTIKSI